MGKKISNILKGEIASSIFYILFGICLILMPAQTLQVIWKVVFGLVLIGDGCYHLYLYLMDKESVTILDLFSGVITIVLGGFLFSTPQIVVRLLTLLLGAFVLVDSIWTLRGCFRLKKRKNNLWKAFLIGSLIFIVLGAVIMVNPFTLVTDTEIFAGWVFLGNGILDIVFYILLKKGMKEVAAGENGNTANESVEGTETGDGQETAGAEDTVSVTADAAQSDSADMTANSANPEDETKNVPVDLPIEKSLTDKEEPKPAEEPLEEWKD